MNFVNSIKGAAIFLAIFISNFLNATPDVCFVNPSSGPTVGGNRITIYGRGFNCVSSVNFGSKPATSFIVISDCAISAIVPAGVAGTVDVRVTSCNETSTISRADFYTYTQIGWRGIVAQINQDGVTLFNTASNTIDTFIPLTTDTIAAVITPDGTRIYTIAADQPVITVIDAITNSVIATIPTGAGAGGFDIIVSPDGKRVYASNNVSGLVTVVDTMTNTVIANVFIAPNLGPLSITPNGKTVYVSNFTLGNVTTIDTATNTAGVSIATGAIPGMISITPDGTRAYVSNSGSDTVSVIDVATNSVIHTIVFPPGSGPYGSSIIPNGKTLYTANINDSTASVVDVVTNTIVDTIPFVPGSRPFWIASTPDSKTAYVISEITDNIIPIDVATNTAGPPFAPIAGEVQDIVISSDPAPVAQFFIEGKTAGKPTLFNASASVSPIGTIASYAWDFGDGTTAITTTPFISHTYLCPGKFIVVLTVTNSAGTSTAKVFSSRFMSNNGGPTAISKQTLKILERPHHSRHRKRD